MNAVDSSVLVAAFARWHERHDAARVAVEQAQVVPGHAALEAYAVLTALPPPRRAPGRLVLDFLAAHFPGEEAHPPLLAPEPATYRRVLDVLGDRGIIGGAVFDGLVAAVAQQVGATLLTLDRRAAGTYAALGAAFEFV